MIKVAIQLLSAHFYQEVRTMAVTFTLLILCVMLQSGFADSSGAITGCVSARSMTPEGAVRLAAVCTFLGSVVITRLNPRVTRTFYGIVDFGEDSDTALRSLCAALCAVIIWSFISHRAGLPTSESHALLSGMTGAALAVKMNISAISKSDWIIVLFGFLLSTLPACLLGLIFNSFLRGFLSRLNRRSAVGHFRRSQKWSAAWNAALYGAQDCQKFTGVYMLGISLSSADASKSDGAIPLSVLLLCTAALTLGTMMGTSSVIKKVGREMCELDPPAYSAAGAAASISVTVCTLLGLPADILQSRACAFIGAGICGKKRTDPRVTVQVICAWLLTFPVCLTLGFLLSYIAQNRFFR